MQRRGLFRFEEPGAVPDPFMGEESLGEPNRVSYVYKASTAANSFGKVSHDLYAV